MIKHIMLVGTLTGILVTGCEKKAVQDILTDGDTVLDTHNTLTNISKVDNIWEETEYPEIYKCMNCSIEVYKFNDTLSSNIELILESKEYEDK